MMGWVAQEKNPRSNIRYEFKKKTKKKQQKMKRRKKATYPQKVVVLIK